MLRVGSKIEAKLIEEVEKDHWIVSFQGSLLQVKNTTPLKFSEGVKLQLIVEKEKPLRLRVLGRASKRSLGLNISI